MVAVTSSDIVTFGDENQYGIVSIFNFNRLLTAVLARHYLQMSRENQILNNSYIKTQTLNFIRHLLGLDRKRCLSRLIGLGHKICVIWIMAVGLQTVVTNHYFHMFLQKLLKCEKLVR